MSILLASLILAAVLVFVLSSGRAWPRLEIEPFPSPRSRSVALALLVVTLALTSMAPLLAFPETDPHADLSDIHFASLFLGHAVLVAFLAGWWWLVGRPDPARFLYVDMTEPGPTLRFGFAAGAAGWAVTMTVMAVVGSLLWALGPTETAAQEEMPRVVAAIVGLSVPQRLLLVLSAGVVEEAFFRSFLQTRTGLVVSSLLFTASHMSYGLPLMLVGVFTVSIVMGVVFRARQNVVPAMIAHAVFDGIQLFLILPAVVAGS